MSPRRPRRARRRARAARDGFLFTEGPVWRREEGALHFSDIPASRRYRWHPADGATVLRDPNDKGNGMTLDTAGNLLVCHHATSTLVRERADGSREIVASHWQGRELNSPNDVIVRSDGTIYFTDPSYGRHAAPYGVPREQELTFQGVYRLDTDGVLHLEADDFEGPNGLCLSPDESLLYVNDSVRAHIRVFGVAADGSLSDGRLFADEIGAGALGRGGRRDEVRRARQRLRHRPGRDLGVRGGRRAARADRRARDGRQPRVGRGGRATLFVCGSTSLYALRMAVRQAGVAAP